MDINTESREKMINSFYSQFDEDIRLTQSLHGQLEYFTTMQYIHKYLQKGTKVLEIGAGTGRYSVTLAKEGYDVTAIELTDHNVAILKENGKGLNNFIAIQGDALNLESIAADSFDVTLVLGPMYHLYDKVDVTKALDEAMRVTKKGGVILFAFINVHSIMLVNYFGNHFLDGIALNFNKDFTVRHFKEQLFTGYDVTEFEELFNDKKTEHLTTVGVDGLFEFIDHNTQIKFTDEEFEMIKKYQLATCEKRELLGRNAHILYICKKR